MASSSDAVQVREINVIDCFTILKCTTNERIEGKQLVINRETQRSNLLLYMLHLRDNRGGKTLNSAVCTRHLERIRFDGSCKAKRVAQAV